VPSAVDHVLIDAPSFRWSTKKHDAVVLDELTLYDHRSAGGAVDLPEPSIVTTLPTGCTIGVRVSSQLSGRDVPLTVFKILSGVLPTERGRCEVLEPRNARLVSSHVTAPRPVHMEATLWFNLVLGTRSLPSDYNEKACGAALPAVWQLCHEVGISSVIIGESFDGASGWQHKKMRSMASVITEGERLKIALVRAVASQCTVLLFQLHIESATRAEGSRILDFVRRYRDGELDELLQTHFPLDTKLSQRAKKDAASALRNDDDAVVPFCSDAPHKNSEPRTVLLAASDELLVARDDVNLVLTIETPSEAHLRPASHLRGS
jgi:hypothetical protein